MRKHPPRFRDGKINLITKGDKTAAVINTLASQHRAFEENGSKGQDSVTSNTDHIDKAKLF